LAGRTYRELLPFADRVATNNAIALGTIASVLGSLAVRLGRDDEAHRHFAHALELEERMGAVMWRPRALLAWGRLLAAEGTRDKASELLGQACSEAAHLGIADVVAGAEADLEELAR
jgi:uncharacterized protein HemY